MCLYVNFKRKKLRKVKILRRGVFLFLLFFLTAQHTNAVELTQKMEVEIGIFDAAEVVLYYSQDLKHFDIKAEVKTLNLFDTLYPFEAQYESSGLILKKGRLVPELYQTISKTRSHVRTKKIFYDDKGKAYKRLSKKDNKEKMTMIKNLSPTADMADLQTVFAELIKNFGQTRRCDMVKEVDDGKKHYRVVVKDAQAETRYFEGLNRTEHAYQCSIYIENLKDNNDNILWDVSVDKPIKVWVGINQVVKIPYLLEINIDSTPLGALKVKPITLEIK